jgi:hypothetical protein
VRRWFLAFPLAALLVSLSSLALVPDRSAGVPLYAARTGLMCQTCHFDPNGGGPRNDFGFAYAKNGHSLAPDTNATEVAALTNRVGENVPLYFGLNQRFMLFANQQRRSGGLDRAGFFDMESALYTVFQPHSRLTLVYSRDGFNEGSSTKDAYGMIALGGERYLKAGQFRVPFGLRMDDHTVATRNSFLDFESGRSFLPYDPRTTDRGIEVGGTHGNAFGRVAFLNGADEPFGAPNDHAQAVAGKIGHNFPRGQVAASGYDDWTRTDVGSRRRSRWGAYGLAHAGAFVLIAELAAGADRVSDTLGIARTGSFAAFGEVNWSPRPCVNLRARFDHLELDRSPDATIADLNTYDRWSLEGEYEPVPFAQIRWSVRLIDPVATRDPQGAEIRDEKQAFVQFHFFY